MASTITAARFADHGRHGEGQREGRQGKVPFVVVPQTPYVRLTQSIAAGKLVETRAVVADRYASGATRSTPTLTLTSPADLSTASSRQVHVTGTTSAPAVYLSVDSTPQAVPMSSGQFDVVVTLPAPSNEIGIAAVAADGGTAHEARTMQA